MGTRFPRAAVLVACLLAGAAVHAQPTPDSLPGVRVVGATEVKKMLDAGAVVIDTRTKTEFAEAHIRGAQNLPYREKSAKRVDFEVDLDRFDLTRLPADKSARLVFYCNAGECWKSYKASKVAAGAGFTAVHWFRGGFPEWKAQGLPVE